MVSKDDVFTVVTTSEANIGLHLRHFPIPLTFAIFDEYGSSLSLSTPSPLLYHHRRGVSNLVVKACAHNCLLQS